MFYQKCPGVGSLDEEQTSQDARSSLAELSELSSTRTSSSADIEINTDTVPVTTNRINDQRKNLTITNNILFINNVTKVFSSTILITTPTLETKSSRYSNIKYNACNSHKTSHWGAVLSLWVAILPIITSSTVWFSPASWSSRCSSCLSPSVDTSTSSQTCSGAAAGRFVCWALRGE